MKLIWKPPAIPQKIQAEHHSKAQYSSVVVFGGFRQDGSIMPSRNFFADAIAQTDFVAPFKNSSVFQGFVQINEGLHANIKQSIQDPKWDWDRQTYRRNKTIVSSPRDIVDTGELLNVQEWSLR